MTYAFLEVERREKFAIVSFNRPERLNALVPEMLDAFDKVMADLDQDPEILVVVLTGKGRAFCAGLDVAVLQEVGPTPFALERLDRHHFVPLDPGCGELCVHLLEPRIGPRCDVVVEQPDLNAALDRVR